MKCRWIMVVVWIAVVAVVALVGVGCANRMFYYPSSQVYGVPSSEGLAFEEVRFSSADGTGLSGWFLPAVGEPKGTVVHFHGNAQNMTAHFPFVSWLPARGFNLFVFDYRGYGASEGKVARDGIMADCDAALDYVLSREGVDRKRVVLLGQSIGGAHAIALAGAGRAADVCAVAADSAFYSYRSVARDAMRRMPLISLLRWPLSFWVVTNGHSPHAVVDRIAPVPLLLMHGTDDEVVPYHHGQDLYQAAEEPKRLVTISDGWHTEALVQEKGGYRDLLVAFFEDALGKEAK